MRLALVVLAAGRSSRYGGLKQLQSVGPSGEALLDYAVYDALRLGYSKIVFVIRPELEADFRDHAWLRYGDRVSCRFVHQGLTPLPKGRRAPPDRVKPWGTGHAVLVAREAVSEPFAVCNADDYYGYEPILRVAKRLRKALLLGTPDAVMVGYTLRETLAEAGGVSRGIARSSTDGYLESLEEVLDIRREEGGITGISVAGDPRLLTGEELASRNLWGFKPDIFPALEEAFARFLAQLERADERRRREAEFLLSSFVGEKVDARRLRVRVVPATQPTFGLTHPEDLAAVQSRLSLQVAEGRYPVDLSTGFRTLRRY